MENHPWISIPSIYPLGEVLIIKERGQIHAAGKGDKRSQGLDNPQAA